MSWVNNCARHLKWSSEPRQVNCENTVTDISDDVLRIYERVRPHTMTNLLRVHALLQGVEHIVRRGIPGAFVECGVWRGGSAMAMLLKLKQIGITDRDIYLYDTFEGMTEPNSEDVSSFEQPALKTWRESLSAGQRPWHVFFEPDRFNFEQARETILSSGYPATRIHFVKGDVKDTIPSQAPQQIALLRLDTDWYESTWHELVHLYPMLSSGGVLIVDDYGHWDGCRRAVDNYFSSGKEAPVLLNRVDYSCRLAIKH